MRTKGGKSHLRRNTSDRTKALYTEMVEVKGTKLIKTIKRLAPNMEK
jgi:large subunit ribosomal protein L35